MIEPPSTSTQNGSTIEWNLRVTTSSKGSTASMNEATTQGLIRLARLIVVAVIAVLIANAGQIVGLIPDDNTKYLVSLVLIPILEGIAKVVGGPTQTMPPAAQRGASAESNRPNLLAI
jgi:hypothetical protein